MARNHANRDTLGRFVATKVTRLEALRKAYELGLTTPELRALTGLSRQRLHQLRKKL